MGEAARKLQPELKPQQQEIQQPQSPKLSVVQPVPMDFDPVKMASKLGDALNMSPPTISRYAKKQMETAAELAKDPLNLRVVAQKIQNELLLHPDRMWSEMMWQMQKYTQLNMYAWGRMWGLTPPAVVTVVKGDNRFRNEEWTKNLWFDLTKQAYLIWAESTQRLFGEIPNCEPLMKKRVAFYTKLFVDAMAPTNFPWTNPEVLHKIYSTRGECLIDGYLNWLRDVERGGGSLNMSTADTSAFEVGKNLAITPGKVVYENELMQLIQYNPTTETVAKTPVLVTPAWINKFYILDLQAKNSFIKYIVDHGFTVFAISWVNPTKDLSGKHFENYMLEGPVEAIEQIKKATGAEKVNMIGYCLGGTLTATTAAYLAGRGSDSVNSVTLLTTLVDFEDPGDLQVFIDKEQVSALEEKMTTKGYLEAQEMTAAFNLLRSNELIWQQMINNYVLAKPPIALDFLAWNADATRMPAEMHKFYLRKMYVENVLHRPNGIHLNKTPINLRRITAPVYQISCKEDHIAPWKSTYAGTQIFAGPRRFVLSESGHIAGVVNPPTNKKYNHWVGEELPSSPDQWFEKAQFKTGSWWDDWATWIESFAGSERVPARHPGDGGLKPIEDAPGTYVKVRVIYDNEKSKAG